MILLKDLFYFYILLLESFELSGFKVLEDYVVSIFYIIVFLLNFSFGIEV